MYPPSSRSAGRLTRLAASIVGIAACVASSLGAQSNAERLANDHYTRSHDYDLIHQRIELRDFDWDSTSFTGRVATTLVALRPGLDSIILDAGALLDVKRISADRDATLRSTRHGDTLVVHLAKPAAFRDTVRFTIDYGGHVSNGRGLTFIDARPHTPKQIWSQGEDHDNHNWFPTYDAPNDKMTWEILVTLPSAYTAVSNGSLVADTPASGGNHTMHWSESTPSATYLASIVIAPLAKIHDTWHDIPVDYYVYHQDSALARPLFRVTPDMIDVYSRLTGVKYPWAKYAQTTVADFFGGMENVSATTLVDWLPDARAYLDRPWYQHILIPHELAHQWFGDYATTENWSNMWLNEGFAEFMPGQYWSQKLGAHAEQDYYVDEYRQFMQIDAQRRMSLAGLGSNNIYPKGALVIEMLKHYLGDDRFWASVNWYLVHHALGNAITDDFRRAILEATGENLDWFFDEWFYQAGYPSFAVSASYDSSAHRVALTVRQTQEDSSKADSTGLRFTTPSVFRMPVTIRVGTARGDVVERAWLDQREQTLSIGGVESAPTMVVFDDGDRILKALMFDQPLAWLTTQLERDPDLWNREWVIAQLAEHGGEPQAVAALAKAATGADYFLTREQAVTALGALKSAAALAPLETAARDTSAQVRAAAVRSLGVVGGAQAIAVARNAWRSDSSYNVRAAAVGALARLDSAGRRALVLQALTTPSYQDVIQNEAIGAIVRARDTTMLDRLQALVGDQRIPVLALAALAARGSDRALDLLIGDLDDSRGYVRGWAFQSLVSNVPPERALPALRAAQRSLKHADAKRNVTSAIATLERRTAKP